MHGAERSAWLATPLLLLGLDVCMEKQRTVVAGAVYLTHNDIFPVYLLSEFIVHFETGAYPLV